MVRRPETYFRISAILWTSLDWPDADRLSRQENLTAGDLRDAFLAANPGWRREQIGVHVNRRNWLEEVRLCYGPRFRAARCDRRRFGVPDTASLSIWRGL